MDKKAEIGIGVLITLAIAVIVGLIMFQQVATNVDATTRANSGAISVVNGSYVGSKDVKVELAGQELVSVTNVRNYTTGAVVPAANYTIAECVRASDGLKGICYTALDDDDEGDPSAEGPVKITYSYYPEGYIDDAGARTITGLIVLLSAVAIALIVLGGIKLDLI